MILRLPNPMIVVVWLAFLVPTAVLGGWADRLLGVAAAVLGSVVLFTQPSPWEARKPSALALKSFVLLEVFYAGSALYSAGFNGAALVSGGWFELLRFVFVGVFVVHLIRHFDARVRAAMEGAMTAGVYAALAFPVLDPRGFLTVMTLCWLLFFSEQRLRFLHAVTATLVVFFTGDRICWGAAFLILSAADSVMVHRSLVALGVRSAARLSVALFLLLTGVAFWKMGVLTAVASAFDEPTVRQFVRLSPVFGWGPVATSALPGRDQYLFWVLKGGALGTAVLLTGLLITGYRLLRTARAEPARLAGVASFLASVALMLTGGRFFESYRLVFAAAFFAAGMFEAGP
jgi:hypothetical protein